MCVICLKLFAFFLHLYYNKVVISNNYKEVKEMEKLVIKKRTADEGLLSKIHKELLKFNNKKIKIQLKKMDKRSELAPHQRKYTDGK